MTKSTKNIVNKVISGVVKRHPDGFGFFIPKEKGIPDIYVPRESMNGVMSDDVVKVKVQKEKGGNRYRGEIVEIEQRTTKKVSGKFNQSMPGQGIMHDESFSWGDDLKISVPPGIKVQNGDWVSVRVTTYPDSMRGFTGEIAEVIGDPGDPLKDNIRVLATHDIPTRFSDVCVRESERIPPEVSEEEKSDDRIDLTKLPFITIDGKTAKDFDDAILVTQIDEGFNLKVAIADVSHYVKPDSAIDKDAQERGNSTYLPNFVAPMLPESLSNELCSLKPNVDRLSMVADMDFGFDGEKLRSKFYEAVIKSHARVTYGQAQEVLDSSTPKEISHVEAEIVRAGDLAKILMARRFKNGSLDLDIPETTVEVDETGVPTDIIKSARLFAHRLIEEMMLAANVAVAEFIQKNELPGIYRIHEPPKDEDISLLQSYMQTFGYKKKLFGGKLQKKLTRALQEFSGAPQEPILNILTLRSMSQAKYSEVNIGHFGLGFDDYSHFTSPIRRYPDLIIHRILKSIVTKNKGYRPYSEEELATFGTMMSACEQRSVKAERQVISIKKARFIESFVGSEFDGVITSVAKFGIFVSLRQYDVDGLVRVEELPGGHYEYDEEQLMLVAKKSGMKFCVGDTVTIQVAAVDTDLGRIDFVLGGELKDASREKKKAKPAKKRGKTKKNSSSVRKARVSKPRRKGKSK